MFTSNKAPVTQLLKREALPALLKAGGRGRYSLTKRSPLGGATLSQSLNSETLLKVNNTPVAQLLKREALPALLKAGGRGRYSLTKRSPLGCTTLSQSLNSEILLKVNNTPVAQLVRALP